MLVTIHQPEHMAWLGFFHKMSQADCYVLLDCVQFEKNNWQNRNKFVDRTGNVFWLTVPVGVKGHLSCTINDILIQNEQPWQRKYWGRFADAYGKHPYFKQYADELEGIIKAPNRSLLVELNLDLIHFFRRVFKIENELVRASNLGVEGKRTDLLVDICTKVGAQTYLSGPSGKDYLDRQVFSDKGVELTFHEFKHPNYEAKHFFPYLSALDLVMNHGEKSREIIAMGQR